MSASVGSKKRILRAEGWRDEGGSEASESFVSEEETFSGSTPDASIGK